MYEETKSSIDWKGLFLKIIIAILIVLIAVKGITTFKSKNNNSQNNQNNVSDITDSKNTSTFTSNMEKLRTAGKNYFEKNNDKLPTTEKTAIMVTLAELTSGGYITELSDEKGERCDGESSYVTATLDGKNIKIKANLVCGNASTYSTVYLNNNTSEETKESSSNTSTNKTTTTTTSKETNKTTISSSTSTSNKTNASTSTSTSNKTNSSACTTNCVPKVDVSVNVSQNVVVNEATNNEKKEPVKYLVEFDSNGGTIEYKDQIIAANDKAQNPGINKKNSCSFKGWYYNGVKYDFSTPVTKNMTLVAYYACEKTLVTKTYETLVRTSAWDTKGTEKITISHTLMLPKEISELNPIKVRIIDVNYAGPLNTNYDIKQYKLDFENTFIYNKNGWEAPSIEENNLSTIISEDIKYISHETQYKSLKESQKGFDIEWATRSINQQCKDTLTVKTVSNLCGYGILYSVTWEYQVYE